MIKNHWITAFNVLLFIYSMLVINALAILLQLIFIIINALNQFRKPFFFYFLFSISFSFLIIIKGNKALK